MPHFFGEILVVTVEELVPDFYKFETLTQTLWRHKDKSYGLKRAQLGGNGRELLVEFDSLPKKIQRKIGDPRKLDHILENYYKVDTETVKFYTEDFQFEDGEYLSEDAQDKHITNATVLKACIALEIDRRTQRRNMGGSMRNLKRTVFDDYLSFRALREDKSPEAFQCTLPQHYNRWLPTYKAFKKAPDSKAAYRSIIKRYKSNTNAQIVRENKEEKLFNDLFSNQSHKPYATEIYQQYEAFLNGYLEVLNEATGEVYDPKGYRSVSERTIQNYLTKWENEIGTHAKRSGNRQDLIGKFSPHGSFERPEFAGSLFSIDDRQPPFEYEKGKRMWFYNGLDVAADFISVSVWGKSKEGIILEFYRQLVRNYHHWGLNLPHELIAESSLNSSYKDTFLREGYMFQKVNINANIARTNPIERTNEKLRYEIEKKQLGWIPRPFAKSEANQAGPKAKELIPYDKLVEARVKDLETFNNSPHPGNPKMTRLEYFLSHQNPDLQPTNYRAFMRHLGHKTQTSCNVGIIKLQNSEWILGDKGSIATGEELIRLMKKLEGYSVDIYWLDDLNGKVFKAFVYVGDHYICEALAKPTPNRAAIERTPEDNAQMALFARYKATIDGYQRLRKNQLEPVTVINERPRTLNSNFVMPQFIGRKKAPSPARDEALELVEIDDNCLEYQPQEESSGSWRSAFND